MNRKKIKIKNSLVIKWYVRVALQVAEWLKEILEKSQNFIELLPSAQSSSRNENLVSTRKNLLNFSCSAQFHMKTKLWNTLLFFIRTSKIGH